ncbi:sigma-54-dependent transcriptional regulator [Halorhodospira halochloris]|nr:sigma-54 dependent transcriptional regulator [Halorhodospira halochloris]MBK1651810.1 sigma-54-dependent Fis family transcriptional regulator [Halorhodospira halochloris]MCG5548273.1 sigma-54 dependent transcriptional regulator [Halorhodospira halochloris]
MGQQRVLVVSRDADRRSEQLGHLARAGFTTVAAEGPDAAHRMLDQGGLAAIVYCEGAGDGSDWRSVVRHPMAPPVILVSATAEVGVAVAAMRDGAADFVAEQSAADELAAAVSRVTDNGPELIAEDKSSRQLIALAQRVAGKDVTVLLTGESGTGKEVFARYIHERSHRADGPFVAVNCAAIPENMLEALLFGFEKGAFTGANRSHSGKFEQAQGGTLLLDEVSEIDLGLQAKLLRALQEKEIERLCGHKPIPLDVRVLASSNRDLRDFVRLGKFREDLYYRLHVFPIHLPPLRDRLADIIPLAQSFALKYAQLGGAAGVEFTSDAQRKLIQHTWPGNVRELENVVQRALILADGDKIDSGAIQFDPVSLEPQPQSVPDWTNEAVRAVEGGPGALFEPNHAAKPWQPTIPKGIESAPVAPGYEEPHTPERSGQEASGQTLEEGLKTREYRLILETLTAVGGNRKEAAARLGISSRTLRYKLARMRQEGVEVPDRGSASTNIYVYGN